MATTPKQENDLIKINQYITDDKGHKVAAVIEIEELKRLEEVIEYLSDMKSIEDRKNETGEDYETYSNKRKSQLNDNLISPSATFFWIKRFIVGAENLQPLPD